MGLALNKGNLGLDQASCNLTEAIIDEIFLKKKPLENTLEQDSTKTKKDNHETTRFQI